MRTLDKAIVVGIVILFFGPSVYRMATGRL